MVHTLISQIAFLALFATCTFAFAKGGVAERWGAALVGLTWLGELIVSSSLHHVFSAQAEELTLLAVDGILAVGLLVLALRFAKTWLGVAMLMQSAELALHGAQMADWGFQFYQYIVFNNLVSFGLLLLLAGATATAWFQRSRAKLVGPDLAPIEPAVDPARQAAKVGLGESVFPAQVNTVSRAHARTSST